MARVRVRRHRRRHPVSGRVHTVREHTRHTRGGRRGRRHRGGRRRGARVY